MDCAGKRTPPLRDADLNRGSAHTDVPESRVHPWCCRQFLTRTLTMFPLSHSTKSSVRPSLSRIVKCLPIKARGGPSGP